MQIASAIAGNADFLVTLDKKGFANSPVQVVTPAELCRLLEK
jgi:predicted nucleic acid-binding protein